MFGTTQKSCCECVPRHKMKIVAPATTQKRSMCQCRSMWQRKKQILLCPGHDAKNLVVVNCTSWQINCLAGHQKIVSCGHGVKFGVSVRHNLGNQRARWRRKPCEIQVRPLKVSLLNAFNSGQNIWQASWQVYIYFKYLAGCIKTTYATQVVCKR